VSRRLEVDQVKYGGHAFRTSSPLQSLDGLFELIRVDLMGRTVQWEFLDEKLPLDYASCQDHVLVAIPHSEETEHVVFRRLRPKTRQSPISDMASL